MDPNVYPKTSAFEKFVNDECDSASGMKKLKDWPTPSILNLKKLLVETVHEYEHGTAEPEDVFDFKELEELKISLGEEGSRDLLLRMYIAVCEDLFQTALYE